MKETRKLHAVIKRALTEGRMERRHAEKITKAFSELERSAATGKRSAVYRAVGRAARTVMDALDSADESQQ